MMVRFRAKIATISSYVSLARFEMSSYKRLHDCLVSHGCLYLNQDKIASPQMTLYGFDNNENILFRVVREEVTIGTNLILITKGKGT